MTEAVSKVSSTEGPGRNGKYDSFAKRGKSAPLKHSESADDTVDISDEARERSGGRRRKKLWEYMENEPPT